MRRVVLARTSGGGYPISIERGMIVGRDEPAFLEGDLLGDRGFVGVVDARVDELYPGVLAKAGARGAMAILRLPEGEVSKSWTTLGRLLEDLAASGLRRDGAVVAIGGGVVGDIAGLAAALLHRGTAVVHVPTTVLAAVDAAIGGKVAVNLASSKNAVGAFHQPRAVLIDPLFFDTLEEREYLSGLAEILKYALLDGEPALAILASTAGALRSRDPEVVDAAVLRSVEAKARLVARDECDTGERRNLNLGHTFGHAIEQASFAAQRPLLHGEAVALVLIAEAALAESLGLAAAGAGEQVVSLVRALGLPERTDGIAAGATLAALRFDKKNVGKDHIRFVLLVRAGHVEIHDVARQDLFLQALKVIGVT